MHSELTAKLYDLVSKGRRVVLKKGEIFQNSHNHLEMSVIKQGYVKRYMIRSDGSLSIQSIYGPGHFFPLTLAYKMLLNQDVYSGPDIVYYQAMTNTVLYSLDSTSFREGVEKDISLYKDLLFVSGRRTHSNIQRLENFSLSTYYKRVAHQLLYFAHLFGRQIGDEVIIQLPLTHQDISDVLSSTRETVSLSLSELKKKKIIKSGPGKKIIITDIARLKEEAYE